MAIRVRTAIRASILIGAMLLAWLSVKPAGATLPDGYNHPELRWSVVEAEHFQVIFHQGSEQLAQKCAAIAESIYDTITQDLGARPKAKTPMLLGDYSDEATAFAVREQKIIYLSAPALNEARVNGDEYLRALVTHEFTHVVTYWAVRGPYWDFGEWTGAGFMPQWFVEGLAQAEAYTFNVYGGALIVRSAALEGALARLAEIDVNAPTDYVDTWLTYAEGHSLVSYIAEEFGKEKIAEILREYSRWRVFDLAMKKALGISQEELFRRWRTAVVEKNKALGPETQHLTELKMPLRAVLSARFSPDGAKLAVLGVADWEEPYPLLYVVNARGSNLSAAWRIAGDVGLFTSVKFGWSPDGETIYYSAKRRTGSGAFRSGIYSVNANGTDRRLLTGDLRAADPAVSSQGDKIVFVVYQDERTLLATMDVDGKNVRFLTPPDAPYQCFSPAWSPDGKTIVFASVFGPYSAIALVSAGGGDCQQLTSGARFDVDPQFSPDGRRIAFVSYYSGIPNVCSMPVVSEACPELVERAEPAVDGSDAVRMTDLKSTSAFYPSWSPDGKEVLFTAFGTRDAVLHVVSAEEKVEDLPQPKVAAEPDKEGPVKPYPVRPYRPLGEFRRYITRTMNSGDGQGTTLGFLTEFADPLRKHTLSAYTEYGLDSQRPLLDLRYANSTLFPILSAQVFSRVASPRKEAGQDVWDEERGVGVGISYPRNPGGRLYRRDTTTLGVGLSQRRPIEATGPIPSPVGTGTLRSASLTWRRSDLFPSKVQKNYALGYVTGGHGLGGDFNFRETFVSAQHQWRAPDLRHLMSASATCDDYDGETFSHVPVRYQLLSGRLAYRLRVGDDVSTRFWPFLYLGRSSLELAWQHDELLTGSLAQPTGDSLSLELFNTGYLTRFGPFTATLGATWAEATQDTDLFFRFHIEPLALPLRQDPAGPPPAPAGVVSASNAGNRTADARPDLPLWGVGIPTGLRPGRDR